MQFHLDHVEEYWQRCLGFLDLQPDHSATFVVGDLAMCIYNGSAAAAPDVHTYCRVHGAVALSEAWERYTQSLSDMSRAHPTVSVAVRRAADEFRRVRAAHGPAPHVAV